MNTCTIVGNACSMLQWCVTPAINGAKFLVVLYSYSHLYLP